MWYDKCIFCGEYTLTNKVKFDKNAEPICQYCGSHGTMLKEGLQLSTTGKLLKLNWKTQEEPSFTYKGTEYFLSEFERISPQHKWLKEFNGIKSETMSTGLIIKIVYGIDDGVIVYRYTTYC